MYKVEQVIQFFLSKGSMTPKKLQKLLYYAYAWTIALLNESPDKIEFKLFDEPIQAWVHGPVIPRIFHEYKKYGWGVIPKSESKEIFSEDVLDILNQVWDVYGAFTADELEAITHRETPWKEARGTLPAYATCDYVISDESMFKFYNEQAAS